ncbi:beta strand repeat-containing protein [Jannaschia sp. 2305UL9-9]|uniref:beta strand repeat-containing protein n=1 Tax=Jannaschia sp. 2305UL9-9 TaxID=3121638 RepID=UPI003526CF2B
MSTPVVWSPSFDVNLGAGTTGIQGNPKIIGLSNGNILVAYESSSGGTIGSGANADIIGKIYDRQGFLVRNEFQINFDYNIDNERDFTIAATNDGGFMMAYMDDDTNGTATRVVLERFDDSGDHLQSRTIASEGSNANLGEPKLVVDQTDNSGFVTWQERTAGSDENIRGVHFTTPNATTISTGSIFDAAQNSSDYDRDHETALLTNGELVVVYEEQDGGTQSMEVRIFNSSGAVAHSNLSALPSGVTGNPQVAGLRNGNFVVIWEDSGDIFGQIFNASASTVGARFDIETGSDNVNEMRVVALPGPASGDFVVVWDDDTDDRTEIRQFNSNGTFDGNQVSNVLNGAGTQTDIGVTVDGRILLTHVSEADSEINAAIYDSRNALDIDASDYSSTPRNFLTGTDVTGKQQASDFDGNSLANAFYGQNGNDTIDGFGGNDTLIGGGGQDSISGGNNDDSIRGGTGNDTISGGFGNDTLVGDTGSDTADYSYSVVPGGLVLLSQWNIDLGAGFNPGSATFSNVIGVGETDQLFTFENLIGSGWRDVVNIQGQDNATNRIETGNGNDEVITNILTINNDYLDGGDGIDTLVVRDDFAATVVYDLEDGEARLNGTKTADILNFENIEIMGSEQVFGTSGANNILVNDNFSSDNVIEGRGGNDTIQGGNGNDRIDGDGGNDLILDDMDGGASTINGGSNTDTLDLSGADAGVTADASTVTSREAGNTTTLELSSIENFIGTDFADEVTEETTGGGFNGIELGGGNDTLNATANGTLDDFDGGGGIDTYVEVSDFSRNLDLENEEGGGAGNPTLIRLANFENVVGGGGDDTITGTDGGGNVLDGGDGNDEIDGLGGDDTIVASTGKDIYNGGDGTDVVTYASFSQGVMINLENDTDPQESPGVAANHTLTGIENVIGSTGNDTLSGTGSSNVLNGLQGNDLFVATGGADTYDGGLGNDTVDYSAFSGAITVDLGIQAQGGGGAASNDTLIEIENVIGTRGDDTITGNAMDNELDGDRGNDSLDGGEGNDTLVASSGANIYVGGGGIDVVDYSAFTGGVTVDLSTVAQSGSGAASNDELSGIENVIGSAGADRLEGDGGDNLLDGFNGNDTLIATGGADTYVGGNGIDIVDYSVFSGAITVDLNLTAQGGGGAASNDTLVEIEGVVGTSGDDTITGDALGNVIDGGGGNDNLDGRGGDDTIIASTGADTYDGDAGVDIVDYSAFSGAITVDLNIAAQGGGGAASNDVLIDIEGVVGTSGNDMLTGDGNANSFDGDGGDDTIDAGGGDDIIIASGGIEVYDGGSGSDTVDYSGFTGAITLDLGVTAQSGSGAAGNDSLTDIENAIGTQGGDVLTGTSDDNRLDGSGGDDTIVATGGAETYIGGRGLDIVDYSAFSGAITVDLNIAAQAGSGAASNDTLESIEGIVGTSGDDSLIGDGEANVLDGSSGDDTIDAGRGNDTIVASGGTETYDGGAGSDLVDYSAFSGAIFLDLAVQAQSGGGAAGNDTLIDIENAIGTNGNDTLSGNAEQNFLDGDDGDDLLTGLGGSDTFHFDSGDGADTVTDFANNVDMIEFDNFSGFTDEAAFIAAFASQVGANVVFDFGGDGMLTVLNTTIGQVDDDIVLV